MGPGGLFHCITLDLQMGPSRLPLREACVWGTAGYTDRVNLAIVVFDARSVWLFFPL